MAGEDLVSLENPDGVLTLGDVRAAVARERSCYPEQVRLLMESTSLSLTPTRSLNWSLDLCLIGIPHLHGCPFLFGPSTANVSTKGKGGISSVLCAGFPSSRGAS